MRVALIVDEFSVEKGTGIARYCSELYQGLKERGIDVEPIMVKHPDIPFGEAINHLFMLPYQVLKRVNEFDIVHATSPVTGLCFPFIRKPKVMTYHDIITMIFKDSGNSLHAKLAAPLFFRTGKWSDRIITVSSQTKEEIVEHLGFPEKKISVVNIGLDNDFKPLEKKKKDHFTIGYVGAFTLRKRIDYLIRAFHHLKKEHPDVNVKLILCGKEWLEYDNLVKLVKEIGLQEYVEFRGFIPQEKLVDTYNSFDVFAITSEWEGFCMPILEAQMCGVPVVIREEARIPKEASECCLKANSQEDMANIMYKNLTGPSFRENIIDTGLDYSKGFTWERTVNDTLKVYEDVLSGTS